MLAHDVAIAARIRIIREIRRTTSIYKREGSNAYGHPEQNDRDWQQPPHDR